MLYSSNHPSHLVVLSTLPLWHYHFKSLRAIYPTIIPVSYFLLALTTVPQVPKLIFLPQIVLIPLMIVRHEKGGRNKPIELSMAIIRSH